jgi:hypothetical protein
MRVLLGLLFALAPAIMGCAVHAGPHTAVSASAPWVGTWQPADSLAVFHVWREGGAVHVEGWDSGDGEWFEISDLAVEGASLRFTSTMPSTDWSVVNVVTLSRGVLLNQRAGASDTETTWVASTAERPAR